MVLWSRVLCSVIHYFSPCPLREYDPAPERLRFLLAVKWHCRASTLQSSALLQAAPTPAPSHLLQGPAYCGEGVCSVHPCSPPLRSTFSLLSCLRDFLWFPLPFSPDCSEPNWNFLCCSGWVSTSLTFLY